METTIASFFKKTRSRDVDGESTSCGFLRDGFGDVVDETNTTDSFALANSTASTINFKDDLESKEESIRHRWPARTTDPRTERSIGIDARKSNLDVQSLRNADRWKLLFGRRKYELLCAVLLDGLWRLWQPIEVVVERFSYELLARTFEVRTRLLANH